VGRTLLAGNHRALALQIAVDSFTLRKEKFRVVIGTSTSPCRFDAPVAWVEHRPSIRNRNYSNLLMAHMSRYIMTRICATCTSRCSYRTCDGKMRLKPFNAMPTLPKVTTGADSKPKSIMPNCPCPEK